MMVSTISIAIAVSFCTIIGVYVIKKMMPYFHQRKLGTVFMKGIGLQPHWLFGSLQLLQPSEKFFLFLQSLLKKYPKINQLWFGPFIWYAVLSHPHVLKPLLESTAPKDDLGYGLIKPWIGDGLLISKGNKWHRNRRLLTRAFHFDILKGRIRKVYIGESGRSFHTRKKGTHKVIELRPDKSKSALSKHALDAMYAVEWDNCKILQYTENFNSCAATMLDKWSMMDHNLPIEVFKDVTLMTLDNMLLCLVSCETNCQTERKENKYIKAVFEMGEITVNRMYNPLMHNDFIFYLSPSGRRFKSHCDYVHGFDEKLIQERKHVIRSTLDNFRNAIHGDNMDQEVDDISLYKKLIGKNLDFLDILLLTKDEDGNGLSDKAIRDEVDTFLFEGHDTTASGISWAFYCLASFPEYQEMCRKEVEQVVGDKDKIEREEVAKLPYLTMFIKEVLRLYPPVYTIARKLSKPVIFPRGFGEDQTCLNDTPPADSNRTMPSGVSFCGMLYLLHRNPMIWKNPTVFDPLRFTPENSKDRSSYAYLPFSAGVRNCIGKNFAMTEMKITLCKALQRFRFFTDHDCPKPEIYPTVVLKARKGIHVKVVPL